MMSVKWSLSVLAGLGFLLLCKGQPRKGKIRICISHENNTTRYNCTGPYVKKRNLQVDIYLPLNESSQSGKNRSCFSIKHSTYKPTCSNKKSSSFDTEDVTEIQEDDVPINKEVAGKTNRGGTDSSTTATSSIAERQFTSTLRPKRKLSDSFNTDQTPDNSVWVFLTGIFVGIVIGVAATSVACCCLAESIADCRKRTCNNACHCCRTDNHVTVTQSSESAGQTLTRQNLAVQDVSIYNEADDINTPRVRRRPVSEHPYEKIQVRHDPSQYEIINNGTYGPKAIGVTSSANKKSKEPTRSKEDSVELQEIVKNEDENLPAMSTVAKNTGIDKASTSIENTVVRNSSPFYFTLVKVESAIADTLRHFKPIHIDDDTQCPEVDRPYFILEKQNADTEIKGVSNTTDNMKDGKNDDAAVYSGTAASENNTSHDECGENSTSNNEYAENNTTHIEYSETNTSHIECGKNQYQSYSVRPKQYQSY